MISRYESFLYYYKITIIIFLLEIWSYIIYKLICVDTKTEIIFLYTPNVFNVSIVGAYKISAPKTKNWESYSLYQFQRNGKSTAGK